MRDVVRFWLMACFNTWSVQKTYELLRADPDWAGQVPSPATVSRWINTPQFELYLRRFFQQLCRMAAIRRVGDLRILEIDSTAIEAEDDPQARWGKTNEGPFLGYKLHLLVNSRGVPVGAVIWQGDRSDHRSVRPLMNQAKQVLTVEQLQNRVKFVVADAGYDAEAHHYVTSDAIGATFLAQENRRNRKSERRGQGRREDSFLLLATKRGRRLMAKRSEIERVFSQLTDPGGLNCEQFPRSVRGKVRVRWFLMAKVIQYTCGIVDNMFSGRSTRTMTYAA
jgi:hypothetical protein